MAPLILPRVSLMMLVLCLFLSFDDHNRNHNHKQTNKESNSLNIVPIHSFSHGPVSLSVKNQNLLHSSSSSSSFYHNSCPHAECIVRATIHHLHHTTPNLVPALICLAFHDCFVQGCDASVLLDDDDYIDSEKESPTNGNLKGFEAGGPFYPLYTGRRDGSNSFAEIATNELPSPYADLSQTLASFKSRGFDEREMVTLLGVHSIGEIHCEFFQNRLYNFNGTNEPGPSLDIEFLNLLRSRCNHTDGSDLSVAFKSTQLKSSASSLVVEPGVTTDFDQLRSNFGMLYYHSLLDAKGILYADQQLMEGEKTKHWVKEYAFHPKLFHRDLALAMMELSDLRVLTLPMGQCCSKVA